MQHPRLYFPASEVEFNSLLSAEVAIARLIPFRRDSHGVQWFRRVPDVELHLDDPDDVDLDGAEIRAELENE